MRKQALLAMHFLPGSVVNGEQSSAPSPTILLTYTSLDSPFEAARDFIDDVPQQGNVLVSCGAHHYTGHHWRETCRKGQGEGQMDLAGMYYFTIPPHTITPSHTHHTSSHHHSITPTHYHTITHQPYIITPSHPIPPSAGASFQFCSTPGW